MPQVILGSESICSGVRGGDQGMSAWRCQEGGYGLDWKCRVGCVGWQQLESSSEEWPQVMCEMSESSSSGWTWCRLQEIYTSAKNQYGCTGWLSSRAISGYSVSEGGRGIAEQVTCFEQQTKSQIKLTIFINIQAIANRTVQTSAKEAVDRDLSVQMCRKTKRKIWKNMPNPQNTFYNHRKLFKRTKDSQSLKKGNLLQIYRYSEKKFTSLHNSK